MNIPTYIEKGAVKNHAADIARLGSRALIITGRNSAKENGALRDVLDVMEETGTRYEIFDEISVTHSINGMTNSVDQATSIISLLVEHTT